MNHHNHHRDRARAVRAAGMPNAKPRARPLVPVEHSNVAVEPVAIDGDGIHRAVVRCPGCNGRAFDVLGVPADVATSSGSPFGSLWLARRCGCPRTPVGRVAAEPGAPPSPAPAGRWSCARGHFLAEVDPASGRVRVPCRKCRLGLSVVPADAMVAALPDDLARAS